MTGEHCHIRPELIEAPEPQPLRGKDLVRSKAIQHGYNVLCAEGPALITLADFRAGFEAAMLYSKCHDGRAR